MSANSPTVVDCNDNHPTTYEKNRSFLNSMLDRLAERRVFGQVRVTLQAGKITSVKCEESVELPSFADKGRNR